MTLAQVEDIGWGPELWDSLNDLARTTIAAHTHVRALIPEGPEAPNAYVVEMPGFADTEEVLEFDVTTTKRVDELEQRFRIHTRQLHDTVRVRHLVQNVALRYAKLEDRKLADDLGLFRGQMPPHARSVVETFSNAAAALRARDVVGTLHAVVNFTLWSRLVAGSDDRRISDFERAQLALGSTQSRIVSVQPQRGEDHDYIYRAVILPYNPAALDLVWAQHPGLTHVDTDKGSLNFALQSRFKLRLAHLLTKEKEDHSQPNDKVVERLAWKPSEGDKSENGKKP